MTMIRLPALLALALLAAPAGAQTRPGSDVQLVPDHLTFESAPTFNVKDCLLAGGRVETYPLTGGRSCNMPTSDGGQTCHTGADCESYCLSETHTCHPWQSLGAVCHGLIEDNGRAVTLCVD